MKHSMSLADIVDSHSVVTTLRAQGKKQLLQDLSLVAANAAGLNAHTVFETLMTREKLGSTGVGQGIAIPHGKFAALGRVHGFFARLPQPVPFDALDGEPVDLVFLLVAPELSGADHLQALARVARLLRDPAMTAKLRSTLDPAALYAILTEPDPTPSMS